MLKLLLIILYLDKYVYGWIKQCENMSDIDNHTSALIKSALDNKANLNSPIFAGVALGIDKYMINFNYVETTAEIDKPICTATKSVLDLRSNINNPSFTGTVSGITQSFVGMIDVNNTTDTAKLISTSIKTEVR